MTLSTPLGLLALLSLPVIMLLHLFRRRQRRFVVSDLGLWGFLRPEVRGPMPRRLPLTWVLILDLLAAALFSFALAGPELVLPGEMQKVSHVVVLLDTSTSMLAEDVSPTRFQAALDSTLQLVDELPEEAAFSLITFGGDVDWAVDSRRETTTPLPDQIRVLTAGKTGHALSEALALAEAIKDETLPLEVYVFTDAAFSRSDISASGINWQFFGTEATNQAVMDIHLTQLSDGQFQVFARLVNYDRVTAVRNLIISDATGEIARYPIELPPESALSQVWTLDQPMSFVELTLEGADLLAADDSAVTGLLTTGSVTVDLVSETPFPLDRAIGILPQAALTLMAPEDYVPAATSGLTIFDAYLPQQLPSGTALILPPFDFGLEDVDLSFLAMSRTVQIPPNALAYPVQDEPLLADIDFSGVRWEKVAVLETIPPGYDPLLTVSDSDGIARPVLLRGNEGNTQVLVLLADLTEGNFTLHPAFPLLMNNIVNNINRAPLPLVQPLGSDLTLPPLSQMQSIEINLPSGETSGRLTRWPRDFSNTTLPGAYELAFEMTDGRVLTQIVGFNAGDPVESDLQSQSWAEELVEEEISLIESDTRVLDLVPYLILLGCLTLIGEAVLAWR